MTQMHESGRALPRNPEQPAVRIDSGHHGAPGEPWRFDESVTDVFDDMLARSIPQYEVMRRTVTDLAALHRKPWTEIVDLGCSRGEAVAPLVERFGRENHYTLCEVSEPMLAAARRRFVREVDRGVVRVAELDLRASYPLAQASVTLSVLTLMFVPIEHRQRVVRNAWLNTVPGGCLIVVEKVLGDTADLDDAFASRYLTMKAENGYTAEEIERKRLSLEGVLVPLTARMNEEMLRRAGFEQVDCFWRWCNFAGWLAVRDGG